MDVWVEFKNASKWQAEALFRNFFPSADEDDEAAPLEMPPMPLVPDSPSPSSSSSGRTGSSLWSMSPSFTSSSSTSSSSIPPSPTATSKSASSAASMASLPQFGATNQAYLPPPVEEHILNNQHSAKPLDSMTLGNLAKRFADAIPDEEFSVAALQGCEWFLPFFVCVCLLTRLWFRSAQEQVAARGGGGQRCCVGCQ